jgi:hypothetical protein
MAGERSVAPAATTVYTLVARGADGRTVEREVELVVEAAPPPPPPPRDRPRIVRFEAVPARVEAGHRAELRWETAGADEVRLAEFGPVERSGARRVQPQDTTTYTLVASNSEGSVRRDAVVEVGAAPPPPPPPEPRPEILSFAAEPTTVRRGGRSELSWKTANARAVELQESSRLIGDGPGKPVGTAGTITVQPAATTTFTLTAANAEGAKASQRLRVVVEEPPPEEPRTRGRGRLDLAEGRGVDLDDGLASGDRGEWDVWLGADRSLYARGDARMAWVKKGTGKAGPRACAAAPLSTTPVAARGIERGAEFCVRTNRGRLAWFVALGAVEGSPAALKISYETWESP